MRVALAQMDVAAGKPKQNLETMLNAIEQAKEEGADLVAFPEMCVGGYLVGDHWYSDNFCENLMEFNEDLRKASEGIAIAYGNVFVDKKNVGEDGRTRKFNATYVFQNGKPAKRATTVEGLPEGMQPKVLLPNYRFFDDKRYFHSLKQHAEDLNISLEDMLQPFVIETENGEEQIGFETCEDLWCKDYRFHGEPINVTKMLVENGAEAVVNLSASPWTFGKNGARDRRVKFLEQEIDNPKPLFYVNATGAQNNGKNIVTFDGGTTIYNSFGDPVLLANRPFEQEIVVADLAEVNKAPVATRDNTPAIEQKYEAILRGIKHVKDIGGGNNQPKYVIGLSGGVDSTVVAKLLVDAVGAENVMGVNLPTKYNSDKTKDAAKTLAENLGIRYQVAPVEEVVEAQTKGLEQADFGNGTKLSTLNDENVQARIRGSGFIAGFAAREGALFTNNGNKLETALGYATLYGDVGGAIAPIGDLTKAEVFELARFINKKEGYEVIPEIMLPDEQFRFGEDQIAPSAELKEEQLDPMKFGYHCALVEQFTNYMKTDPEDIMEWYKEGTLAENLGIDKQLVTRYGLEDPKAFVEDLEWVTNKIQWNVFKRVQSPPNIITSKGAYGYDIRESQLPANQTRKYQRLKEDVLAMKQYEAK